MCGDGDLIPVSSDQAQKNRRNVLERTILYLDKYKSIEDSDKQYSRYTKLYKQIQGYLIKPGKTPMSSTEAKPVSCPHKTDLRLCESCDPVNGQIFAYARED